MKVSSFRDLWMWKEARSLAADVGGIAKGFPYKEPFGMASQLCRAANSVTANIAEGWGRESTREYHHALSYAKGSACEMVSHLIASVDVGLISKTRANILQARYEKLALAIQRCMWQLQRKIQNSK